MGTDVITIQPAASIRGTISVPGDKSITHRALLLNAIAKGKSQIIGAGLGDDCLSTLSCLHQLGVQIERVAEHEFIVHGIADQLRASTAPLNCGNSGTTMRLLLGILSSIPQFNVLFGDSSLTTRPMGRVAEPLRQMGASIDGRQNGNLPPLAIKGNSLKGIEYCMPVASAQLKSALLLAAIRADGTTVIDQPSRSRDHTELMLSSQGINIDTSGNTIKLDGGQDPIAVDVAIPGDISSAAFWMILAAIHPDADLSVKNVGSNPTRAGVIMILERMGAQISRDNLQSGSEPAADFSIKSSFLNGTTISGEEIPLLIDELPAIAVAATQAEGTTIIRDANELRVKESDRISTMYQGLQKMGAAVEELEDGLIVHGPSILRGAKVQCHGDHRVAMALAIAASLADGETELWGASAASISYPAFWRTLQEIQSV